MPIVDAEFDAESIPHIQFAREVHFNLNMTGGVFKIGSSERGADTNGNRFFSVSAYDSDGVVRINPGPESTMYLNREVGAARNLHVWDGNANQVMSTIGSTRRVGIGTTNPGSKL